MACMLWENQFYESGEDIAKRIASLVSRCDGATVARIAEEARNKMHLRHVPLFLARELARHLNKSYRLPVSSVLETVIQRPDELTEFVALYWKDKREPLSAQAKKGLARAFQKFNEYSLAKYNRDGAVKLRDVLFLCHAKPKDEEQALVWKKLVDGTLATPDTWEVNLSAGKDKKETWERLISEGKLGGLATLRNLRNMQDSGLSDEAVRSAIQNAPYDRVLPFRFLSAARYAPKFEPELERAMFHALTATAKLPGKTALVVDSSGSMFGTKVSEKSELDRFEAAAALAVLLREICESVAVYAFNNSAHVVPPRRGFALRDALKVVGSGNSFGGLAVAMANKDGYDRIIVLTDGQWHFSKPPEPGTMYRGSMGDALVVSPAPLTERAYMINVGSYKNGIGYGKWTSIDGWSEAIVDYIKQAEEIGT